MSRGNTHKKCQRCYQIKRKKAFVVVDDMNYSDTHLIEVCKGCVEKHPSEYARSHEERRMKDSCDD